MSAAPFPLAYDGHLRITLTTPLFAEDGPYMVIRWSEPDRDQVRYYRWHKAAPFEVIADWCLTISLGHLTSAASGVRRALGALERSGCIILA